VCDKTLRGRKHDRDGGSNSSYRLVTGEDFSNRESRTRCIYGDIVQHKIYIGTNIGILVLVRTYS